MFEKNIISEARLTGFKAHFSHLLGLGIKFGPKNVSTFTKLQTIDKVKDKFFSIRDRGTVRAPSLCCYYCSF